MRLVARWPKVRPAAAPHHHPTHLSSTTLQWLISDECVSDLELDIADGLVTQRTLTRTPLEALRTATSTQNTNSKCYETACATESNVLYDSRCIAQYTLMLCPTTPHSTLSPVRHCFSTPCPVSHLHDAVPDCSQQSLVHLTSQGVIQQQVGTIYGGTKRPHTALHQTQTGRDSGAVRMW